MRRKHPGGQPRVCDHAAGHRAHRRVCSPLAALNKRQKREYGQASRKISTGRLNALPHLDRQPIDQIFSLVPSVYLK